MIIKITLVKEDLLTIVKDDVGTIELDAYFFEITKKLNLTLLSTIDSHDMTIFNRLQLDILEKEIQQLRNYKEIDQVLLDTLDHAVKESWITNMCDIKLMGNSSL